MHHARPRRATGLAVLAAVVLGACTTAAPPRSDAPVPVADVLPVVAETWTGAPRERDELDSLATWTGDDGRHWLLASAKASDRILVFDAAGGDYVGATGQRGDGPGAFHRPNGLAVFGDLLFVVERDNRRVQVLRLPGLEPAGTFGQPALRSPYGIWLHETAPGELEAYVTDSFMDGARFDIVPPLDQLDRRVRRYRLQLAAGGGAVAQATPLGSFGDTTPAGALRIVESIAGDPAHDRLLVADEDRSRGSTLREYTLDGRWTGRGLPDGSFAGEAEGVVLWSCRGDRGYWLAVDQQAPLTAFHLFDRDTLAPRGSFTGETTAMTDGIAIDPASSPAWPHGALFAVHQDRSVVAFDLGAIVRALDLDRACLD